MNKKQLGQLIREQRPEPPNGYEARMEYRLARLTREEESMKKRYKFSTVLVAAVLMVAVLAGTAFAASMLGIFDFFKDPANPIIPLEGAEGMVATNLGISENEYAILTVEEAVFDGQGVLVQCRLTPKDAENYALFDAFMQDAPEDTYIRESVPVEVEEGMLELESESGTETIINENGIQQLLINGVATEIPQTRDEAQQAGLPVYQTDGKLFHADYMEFRVLGRKDGKKLMGYWISMETGDERLSQDVSDLRETEDGSLVYWASGMASEVMDVSAIEVRVNGQIEMNGQTIPMDAICFTLPKSEEEREYTFTPAADAFAEDFEILNCSMVCTKVRGYMKIDFRYDQQTYGDMGIDFRLYDAAGERINTGSGSCGEVNDVFSWDMEIQSFDEVPESIWLEAKVIGWDKTLGKVECRLIESTDANSK